MNGHIFDASCWCAPVVDGDFVKHDLDAGAVLCSGGLTKI